MKINKNDKGFTLIELMIVVAIIGILAAIAIPQFNKYRIKAFNASALSDAKNVQLAEEGLYTDYQLYGDSGTGGAQAIVDSNSVSPYLFTYAVGSGGGQRQPISVSNNVSLVASTGGLNTTTYVILAKHFNGDREFGIDSDASGIYYSKQLTGTALASGISATAANDLSATMTILGG